MFVVYLLNQLQNIVCVLGLQESIKSKDTPKTKGKSAHETEDEEEEDDENGVPVEDNEPGNSKSKEKEFESEEAAEVDKDDNDDSEREREKIKSPEKGGLAITKKSDVSSVHKKFSPSKGSTKSSSSKRSKDGDKTGGDTKAFLRKHRDIEPPSKKAVSSKKDLREKSSGMPSNHVEFA